MKQKYVKPSIIIERFALTQSIASGCGAVAGGNTLGKPTISNVTSCAWDLISHTIFVEGNRACGEQVDPSADIVIGAYCYNNPEGGNAVFSSF